MFLTPCWGSNNPRTERLVACRSEFVSVSPPLRGSACVRSRESLNRPHHWNRAPTVREGTLTTRISICGSLSRRSLTVCGRGAKCSPPLADYAACPGRRGSGLLLIRGLSWPSYSTPGNANKEIAVQLSIAEETAKSHVTNILAKLGAYDRTHAVTIGLKRGIIEL
jgi:hypothetical protein